MNNGGVLKRPGLRPGDDFTHRGQAYRIYQRIGDNLYLAIPINQLGGVREEGSTIRVLV